MLGKYVFLFVEVAARKRFRTIGYQCSHGRPHTHFGEEAQLIERLLSSLHAMTCT
jgi:hypothetical protein